MLLIIDQENWTNCFSSSPHVHKSYFQEMRQQWASKRKCQQTHYVELSFFTQKRHFTTFCGGDYQTFSDKQASGGKWLMAANNRWLCEMLLHYADTQTGPGNSLETQIQTMMGKRGPSEGRHTSQAAILPPWNASRKLGNSSCAILDVCVKWLLSSTTETHHLLRSDTQQACKTAAVLPWNRNPAERLVPTSRQSTKCVLGLGWHSSLINVCDLNTLLSTWALSGVNNSTI